MYHSTRGEELVSGAQAIVNGIAPDGGLYVIDQLPEINYKKLMDYNYVELACFIINKFFPEFEYNELFMEIKSAYQEFDIEEVINIKDINNPYFLELFHGPTLAFKDFALVVLPRLMKLAKKKLNIKAKTNILVATSGDTGGAALNGFKDVEGFNIIVLYPNNGVSHFQEQQMLSLTKNNAKVYAVEGNFDDCQCFVKNFFRNNKDLNLGSANSINIGRLVPQIVYYFYSYMSLVKNKKIKTDEMVNFIVPTGNFGNIFAGYYAKLMGLPINNLIVASNENDILTDCFRKGIYDKNREFIKTNSPSMDILVSSNLERLIYYSVKENTKSVSKLMKSFNETGKIKFNNPFSFFKAFKTNQEETKKIINDVNNKYNYLIDPHTAVAYGAYLQLKDKVSPNIIVSTASPYKFMETIKESISNIEVNLKSNNENVYLHKEVITLEEANIKLRKVIECLE